MAVSDREDVVEAASRLLLRHHVDAWHALAWARMTPVEQSILRLYALEDWSRWRWIEPTLVAFLPAWYARTAAHDAMARILWRRAPFAVEHRALQLGVRAADYRQTTRRAEAMLRSWLHVAAVAYLLALAGRDGFTPADRHDGDAGVAASPRRPSAVPRDGQQELLEAA